MTHSSISNSAYKVVLLASAVLLVLASMSALWVEMRWFYMGHFFANSLILSCYYYKSSYLKRIVRVSALIILLHTATAFYPVVVLGFFYGMSALWPFIPLFLIMPALGIYLYWGSNRYIQLIT
jgi:hypothetical protein